MLLMHKDINTKILPLISIVVLNYDRQIVQKYSPFRCEGGDKPFFITPPPPAESVGLAFAKLLYFK